MASLHTLARILVGVALCLADSPTQLNDRLEHGDVKAQIQLLDEALSEIKSGYQAQARVISELVSHLARADKERTDLKLQLMNAKTEREDLTILLNRLEEGCFTNYVEARSEQSDEDSIMEEIEKLQDLYSSIAHDLEVTTGDLNATRKALQIAKQEFTTVEMVNKEIIRDVDKLTHRLASPNTSCHGDVSQMKDKLTAFESMFKMQMGAAGKMVLGIETGQVAIKENLTLIESILSPLNLRLHSLEESLASVDGQLTSRNDTPIVFSSVLTKDTAVAKFQTVEFDETLVNSGGGFNNHTGVFTCPRDGIYSFYVHVQSPTNVPISLRLLRNKQVISSLSQGLTHETSNSVIATCQDGEEISVISMSDTSTTVTSWHTAFAGFMIR